MKTEELINNESRRVKLNRKFVGLDYRGRRIYVGDYVIYRKNRKRLHIVVDDGSLRAKLIDNEAGLAFYAYPTFNFIKIDPSAH